MPGRSQTSCIELSIPSNLTMLNHILASFINATISDNVSNVQ